MIFDYPQFGSNALRTVFEVFPRRGERVMGLVADVMEPTEELSWLDRELIFAYSSSVWKLGVLRWKILIWL